MQKTNTNRGELESILEQQTTKHYGTAIKRNKGFGVIYTRVSSQEQAQGNGSLEVQKKYCEEYAKRNSIVVKESFGGTFESAKTDGRKEFQRMLTYIKKDKDISNIIVFNFDRFSRSGSGAAHLSEELGKNGIILKSVTQDIDASKASGRLQENFFHLLNHFDNQSKSDRTIINTREVMLKGYWPYATPRGYKNLKPKHRACFHEYIITDEGTEIKKAFQLKAEGKMTNKDIITRLSAKGLRITEKNFRWMLSNPFYAGYVTGHIVSGKLIKGLHPALIDLKTFLKANELMKDAVNVAVPKQFKKEALPLKVFAREELSGASFTGYIKKGNWYYKTMGKGIAVNISAKQLNELFVGKLKQFEFKKQYTKELKQAMITGIKKKLSASMEESVQLKKRLSEKRNLLEKMEEKYVIGELKKDLYEKYLSKYQNEIAVLEAENMKNSFSSSNLEKAVEKGLGIAQNISQMWVSSDYTAKQRLQYLLFPEGILYSKQKNRVRTLRVNGIFATIEPLAKDLEENKKGNLKKDCLKPHSVPRTGIEPAHPCERQILSLLRLPIPPSGLSLVGC